MSFDLRLVLGLAMLSWALAAAMASYAQASPVHPRLYFSAQDFPRLAQLGYATPDYLGEQGFRVTYFGDHEIAFPLPPRQPDFIENPPGFDAKFGHYPYWTGMSRQIQRRLESLALSYAATRDPRYARRAIEYMLALAGWNTWSDSDYGNRTCLDTCHLTMGFAFAYDACWEAMSAPERGRVREALQRLGLGPLARDAPERAEHNLQMLRNSALGLGSLALLPEQPEAEDHLQLAKDFFRWWLDLRDSSSNTEGLAYTSYGLDSCLLFGAALAQAEGDRGIVEHRYLARAVRWALYFWGPGASGLVNFCDASVGHPFEVTMRVANKYLGDPFAGHYLKQAGYLDRKDFTAAILHHPKPAVAWPPPWEASALFRSIGWAALRSGWGDDDLLFAFICSSSREGHCHFDANHFVINCAGEWLAADSGYKSFKGGALTDFSQGSAGHNTVLIAGAGQKEQAGAITDFFISPSCEYLVGDASRCYDPQILWRFLRRVLYVRPHFFLMLDELEAPEAKRFEFLLHTERDGQYAIEGKAAKLGETVTGSRVSLVKPRARLEVRFLEPAAAQLTLDHHKGTKEEYPPYIIARDSRPRESQRFLTALVPARKAVSDHVLELEHYLPADDDSVSAARNAVVRLETYGALLLRARAPGDSLTLSLPVPADGEYRVIGHFLKSPAYGDWQVRVDGEPAGAVYCGYAPDVRTHQEWDLGVVKLSRGRHDFSFTVTGRHQLSSGYLVGLDDIELKPREENEPARETAPTRFRRLSGEGWIGAACLVDDARCRAYFRLTGADEIADKELRTDADAALIVERERGEPEIAAYRATRVAVGGRDLVEASAPVSFALIPGKEWSLTLAAEGRADVVLFLKGQPRRPNIPPSLARGVRYDPTALALRIRLRPGSHTITWSMR